jgi:tetratricopeptide (TPR) repeat protein
LPFSEEYVSALCEYSAFLENSEDYFKTVGRAMGKLSLSLSRSLSLSVPHLLYLPSCVECHVTDFPSAGSSMEQALAQASSARGICYLMIADYSMAAAEFERAKALDESNAALALWGKAKAYAFMGNISQAIDLLSGAIAASGDLLAGVYQDRATLYSVLHKQDEAVQDMQTVAKIQEQQQHHHHHHHHQQQQQAQKQYGNSALIRSLMVPFTQKEISNIERTWNRVNNDNKHSDVLAKDREADMRLQQLEEMIAKGEPPATTTDAESAIDDNSDIDVDDNDEQDDGDMDSDKPSNDKIAQALEQLEQQQQQRRLQARHKADHNQSS